MSAIIAGRYEIAEAIGIGSAGEVFRALDLRLQRPVAIKLLHSECASGEESKARFLRETKVCAALDHRAIVDVYDFGVEDGTPYIVMELLEGAPLRQLLDKRRGPMPVEAVLRIGSEVAHALAHAHDRALVHRDIKPENIMINGPLIEPDRTTLLDFGLAFSLVDGDLGRRTDAGILAGTPNYMAPEQASGSDVDAAADVYALGGVLYEMIAGTTPFTGAVASVLSSHMYLPPVSLLERVADDYPLLRELDDMIHPMLAKSPSERPSAASVAIRLDNVAAGHIARRRSSPSGSREERMVDAAIRQSTASTTADAIAVAVIGDTGALPPELLDRLGVLSELAACDAVITILDASSDIDGHAFDVPCIAYVTDADARESARLIRKGAADVLNEGVDTETAMAKISRAIRSHRRRRGGER